MASSKLLTGIILGAAAGIAIALFVQSDKGQDMVENLKDAAGDAGEKLKSKLDDLQGEMSGLIKKGKKYVSELESKAKESFE
jgi:gas vesicle protein